MREWISEHSLNLRVCEANEEAPQIAMYCLDSRQAFKANKRLARNELVAK